MSGGRISFYFFLFTVIVIVFSLFSFPRVFSFERHRSIVKSFTKLVDIKSKCSSAENSNASVSTTRPCPLSNNTVTVKEIPCEREGPWYAKDKIWHYPVLFPRCSMDVCFNYSRCENMDDILIFTYDTPSPPHRFFYGFNTTQWYTSDPNKACLFLVFVDIYNNPWYNGHPRQLPYWNNGSNHVLVSFADKWSLTKIPMETTGFASLLISDMHETIYCPGFDISVPHPPKMRPTQFQNIKPFARKYFLTFKGLAYLWGGGVLRSHESFTNMHNGEDIIVALSCRHPSNDYKNNSKCDQHQTIYNQYNYVHLMNSTFGLAPAGRQPSSYRLSELICAGTIPVLIADNYVKPFDTVIHWHNCMLEFPTNQMHRIVPILRRISQEEVEERQKYCLQIFWEVYKDDETMRKAAVASLKTRMMGFFPNSNTPANL